MIFIGSIYEHDSIARWIDIFVSTMEELEESLKKTAGTKFVFWLGVSNITGEIFPAKDIGCLCHKYNAFYICDATALLGHAPIEPNIDDWCDFLILDGHKIGTELGIGCCWVSDRLDKWLNGFKLHGTPNLAGALAMTDATEFVIENAPYNELRYYELIKTLKNELEANGIEYNIMGDKQSITAHAHAITAITLDGLNADSLQQFAASRNVFIGVGHSACDTESDYRVLVQGFGLTEKQARETVRISFDWNTDAEDIDKFVDCVVDYKERFNA